MDWGRWHIAFFWSLGMVNHKPDKSSQNTSRIIRNLDASRWKNHSSRNFFELIIMASHGGFAPHPGLPWKCRLSRQIECLELPSRSTQKSLIFIAETPQGKRNQSSVCSEKPEGFVNLLSVTQENLMKSQIIDDSPLKSVEHLLYSLEKYTIRCLPHLITSSGCTRIPMLCLFHSRAMLNTPPTSKIMWIQPRIPCG